MDGGSKYLIGVLLRTSGEVLQRTSLRVSRLGLKVGYMQK